MTSDCPKCYRRLGLVPVEIAVVGNLLQCTKPFGCGAALMVTVAGPSPADFEVRVATEAEKTAWTNRDQNPSEPPA
jgi:hypothetical protein